MSTLDFKLLKSGDDALMQLEYRRTIARNSASTDVIDKLAAEGFPPAIGFKLSRSAIRGEEGEGVEILLYCALMGSNFSDQYLCDKFRRQPLSPLVFSETTIELARQGSLLFKLSCLRIMSLHNQGTLMACTYDFFYGISNLYLYASVQAEILGWEDKSASPDYILRSMRDQHAGDVKFLLSISPKYREMCKTLRTLPISISEFVIPHLLMYG